MKKKHLTLLFVLVLIIIVFCGLYYWLGDKSRLEKPVELIKVRFAMNPTFLGEAAFHLAYHNGYFKEEGLEITLIKNLAGWQSLKNLFEGDADIANVADLPISYSALDKKKYTDFERGDFYIITDLIYSNKIQQVLARKDRGIYAPEDIKGKRVGLLRGTTADFFLDAFLTEYNLKASDIEVVNMGVFEQVEALVKGDLDVIFSWQPHILNAQKLLGDNAIILPTKLTYTTAWLSVVMKEYAEEHPEVLEKYLRAIYKANQFIKENREEAITIHAEMSDVDREVFASLWNDIDYKLSLSEALLTTLEDEARWIIRNKLADQTEVPNFLDFIYFDALEKVNPEGITIIR